MEYITISNLERTRDNIELTKINFDQDCFHKIKNLYKKYSTIELVKFSDLLYKNKFSDVLNIEIYQPLISHEFKEVAQLNGRSAYHIDPNCERLNSDLVLHKIPEEIELKGQEVKSQFISWIRNNKEKFKDTSEFNFKIKKEWNLTKLPEIIFQLNSGICEFENYNIEEIELKIENQIKIAQNFLKDLANKEAIIIFYIKFNREKKISEIDINSLKDFTEQEIKIINEYFKIIYNPLKLLLTEYYKVFLCKGINFQGPILESLGFRACKKCINQYMDVADLF